MSYAKLIDTTRCIGCHACQVICKEWNALPGEVTQLPRSDLVVQNPPTLSAKTYMLITHHEVDDPTAPAGFRDVFTKRQCMHCDEPACVSACPVTALRKTKAGPVTYDAAKCIGCRYCVWACPFGAISAEWDSLAPKMSKCTLCADRLEPAVPLERNGQVLSDDERTRFAAAHRVPACVKQCPAGALDFGIREDMLATAKARIAAGDGKYVDHVYGEKEAGGTATFYLSAVPPEQIGLPAVGFESYPARSVAALSAVPPAVVGVGAVLGASYALGKRKAEVAKAEAAEEHHPEFAAIARKLWTPANVLLAALMAFGALSFAARFALGLGGSTHLSDTWAWGLWIVFDLVWIAVAAGAFATAGIIYVFRREDLYSVGRSAVLMGLLSYSFVTVTLVADLGLPWHFWQLGVQAPEHSAMFEVSWCVGLYVTILALEFMPVAFERWHMQKAMARWRSGAPLWVVVSVTLFVYLMSRSLAWAGLAFAVFGLLAWAFRPKGEGKPVPIMLAIAAVTLSTMHQSSLGSLFLLMPDKLDARWWSPALPVYFFLSSVAAGLALVVLVEVWIAKAWGRALRVAQLASLGKLCFWSLLAYEALRVGDLAVRGQLGAALDGPRAALLAAELVLGGVVPLAILGARKLRERPAALFWGALLACGGVVLNRANVVVFAMELRGQMPQDAPQAYLPSAFEWGVSAGLIAATIFLFGWAARNMPVLPKEEHAEAALAPAGEGVAS
ncbi:MAG TPA: 4Fe-4S dicluster domain-containing protein [Anaeromyxobacter sp.]|nr:4Fe-4S dicluster domain-containing protein [Anaeromyxobacter sp.]